MLDAFNGHSPGASRKRMGASMLSAIVVFTAFASVVIAATAATQREVLQDELVQVEFGSAAAAPAAPATGAAPDRAPAQRASGPPPGNRRPSGDPGGASARGRADEARNRGECLRGRPRRPGRSRGVSRAGSARSPRPRRRPPPPPAPPPPPRGPIQLPENAVAPSRRGQPAARLSGGRALERRTGAGHREDRRERERLRRRDPDHARTSTVRRRRARRAAHVALHPCATGWSGDRRVPDHPRAVPTGPLRSLGKEKSWTSICSRCGPRWASW